MTPTQEQLSKLPKWAQDHIRDIAFIPSSYLSARLVSKEDMS